MFPKLTDYPSNCTNISFTIFAPRILHRVLQSPSLPRPKPQVGVIVLSGSSDHFGSGIDLKSLTITNDDVSGDRGCSGERLCHKIIAMQDPISAVEGCRKPVIAVIHGVCVGGVVDLIIVCDIKYCTADAMFSVKEVDLAITTDLGTLQRLPMIFGYGRAMELALTGWKFLGSEAKEMGLVSRILGSEADLDASVTIIADEMSEKSPLAVTRMKAVMLKSRDMSIEQVLDYVATWNSSMLLSDDLQELVRIW